MKAAQEFILHRGLKANHFNNSLKGKKKQPYLSGYHLRENLMLQQDVKAYFSLQLRAQIRSNVYNKPDHIAQPEPVFLRLAFMTFYPTLKINQPA